MNEQQLAEARRWVALRGWRWVAGMLARRVRDPWWEPSDQGPRIGRGHRVLHVEHVIVYCDRETFRHPSDDFRPDITDPATRGCLRELAREITGRPGLTTIPSFDVVNPGDPAWCARWPEHCVPSLGRVCAHETAALLWKCEDFERAQARRTEVDQ